MEKSNLAPKLQNFAVPAGGFKKVVAYLNHRGRKIKLKGLQILATGKVLILVDDSFARYKGHLNRMDLLTKYEQVHNAGNLLLIEPSTGAFITLTYRPPSINQFLN